MTLCAIFILKYRYKNSSSNRNIYFCKNFSMRVMKNLLSCSIVCLIVICSCKKDQIITDKSAGIAFSADTVLFDTILTSIGSVTKRFKIYNPHSEAIVIKDLYVGGGTSSYYKINVDGTPGNSHKDIKIAGKDSLYVFVQVTIDPLSSNSPMLINDSVVCLTNGNMQNIKLVAFGQDVNLFKNKIFKTQTWTSQKPYLIYNNAAIDSNEVLTIEAGTKIFFNNNSSLLVWGRVEAKGTLENPIVFSGDRFDAPYNQTAGQWGTIYFDPKSTGNLMDHVIIKNSTAGLQVGYAGSIKIPAVELRNCMILNASIYGILGIDADITAYNTIVADCGFYALALINGGNYNFLHCTISNISSYAPSFFSSEGFKPRSTPSILVANNMLWQKLDENFNIVNVTYHNEVKAFNFYNSILYGILSQEILFSDDKKTALNYKFDHSLITNNKDSLNYTDANHFVSIILNKNPQFKNDSISRGEYNFQLDSLSPAIDSGSIEVIKDIPQVQQDFNGKSRTVDGKPDLGAFERYE